MSKIRVLIVDDSAVVRRLLRDALGGDDQLEIVGTAQNGRVALAKIALLRPDVVTLDVEMPEMDGLALLAELRLRDERPVVVMLSSYTQRGALATVDALSLGAADYVAKPALAGSVGAAMETIRRELIPRIKALCVRPSQGVGPAVRSHRPGVVSPRCVTPPRLLAIGVSTGGPNALAEVFRRLPKEFPLPIVIVQHMPPMFTRCLAQRLDGISPLAVREAVDGERLHAGGAWLAPGDWHLSVARDAKGMFARLDQCPPENSCRPAVDVLFRSAAETIGAACVGVLLTGMGQDGLRGCEAIRRSGGQVLAQDESTSVVWGMPGAVVRAGLADQVLPLDRMSDALVRLAGRGGRSSAAAIFAKG